MVGRVIVEGHEVFSTRQILETVGLRSGDVVSELEVRSRVEDLLRRYRDSGYPRVTIGVGWDPGSAEAHDLHLWIDEGSRFRVHGVRLDGCGGVECRVLESLMETRPEAILRVQVLEADMDRLLEAYADGGYPYVRIGLRPAWSDPGGIDLDLGIEEGPRVVIDRIAVRGNSKTRGGVIRRACGISEGELYSERRVRRIEPRLMRLGYFDRVSTSVSLLDSAGRGALDIEVSERKTNSLYGAVGYVPREPEGYLTGILDVAFHNIAGTGRSARVRWRTYQPGAFEWTFAYGEPWIAGVPLSGGLSIHQEVEDSTFTLTRVEASLEYPLRESFWARLAGTSEGVVAGSGGKGVIRGSRRTSGELGARLDLRDDVLNPTRGSMLEGAVGYGRKRYEDGDEVLSTVYRASAGLFASVARRQVVALNTSVGWLDSSEREIPEHEQFAVGGAESLRGYGEDAFFGWRVVTLGAEYRFLLGRRSRLHLFVDGGWLDRRLPEVGGWVDRETWLLGYGTGVRSESRLGMLGVDFGLARGEPLTEGKVHLRLEGEF